jgi:hypothetical protein
VTTRRARRSAGSTCSSERVARTIVKIAGADRVSDRYQVGAVAHALPFMRRWLPSGLWDRTMSRQSGVHLITG